MKSPVYDHDFLLWSEQQAAALRAGNLASVDAEGLLEELEDMGNERREALQSLIRNILTHLLKLEFSPSTQTRAGWVEEITEWRAQAETKIDDTPSLKHYMGDLYRKAWPQARKMAEKSFKQYDEKVKLPSECPYSMEQVLDYDFFPEM